MMCMLALVSLLTHLGLTTYRNFSEEQHLAAVARELEQALRAARNQAALLRRAVLVEPLEGDWGKGWRSSQERDGQLLAEQRLSRPVSISATSARAVRFSGRGAPLGIGFGGTTLDICQRATLDSRHQVVLSPTGRVSLRSDGGRRCAGG